jgi:hypothetical protein
MLYIIPEKSVLLTAPPIANNYNETEGINFYKHRKLYFYLISSTGRYLLCQVQTTIFCAVLYQVQLAPNTLWFEHTWWETFSQVWGVYHLAYCYYCLFDTLFLSLFILDAGINHMSENVASLPVHYGSLVGDVFFMLNLLVAHSLFSGSEGVDDTAKAWAFQLMITKTSFVNDNPPELVTTNHLWYLRWFDFDLPCAFSAMCTPLEGFGECLIQDNSPVIWCVNIVIEYNLLMPVISLLPFNSIRIIWYNMVQDILLSNFCLEFNVHKR